MQTFYTFFLHATKNIFPGGFRLLDALQRLAFDSTASAVEFYIILHKISTEAVY